MSIATQINMSIRKQRYDELVRKMSGDRGFASLTSGQKAELDKTLSTEFAKSTEPKLDASEFLAQGKKEGDIVTKNGIQYQIMPGGGLQIPRAPGFKGAKPSDEIPKDMWGPAKEGATKIDPETGTKYTYVISPEHPKGIWDPGETEETIPAVVSATPTETDIGERGEDPTKIDFKDEDEFDKWKQRVQPVGGEPTRGISRVDEFTQLREEYGIEGIEDELTGLVDQQEALMESLRTFTEEAYKGQDIRLAAGRITEAERNVQERLDILQRRERTLRGRLDTRNKTIETIMGLTDADYEDARDTYEFEFNKNLSIATAVATEEQRQFSHDNAAFQTLFNIFEGKSIDDITPDILQKANELETKLGYPVGIFETAIREGEGQKIVMHGTSYDEAGNQFAYMVYEGKKDEPPVIKQIYTEGYKRPSKTEEEKKIEKEKEEKEAREKEAEQIEWAKELIKLNPNAPDAELSTQIRLETDLSESQIKEFFKDRFSESEIIVEAEDTVVKYFKRSAWDLEATEIKKARQKAIEDIEGDASLSDEVKDRIIKAINKVTWETADRLSEAE